MFGNSEDSLITKPITKVIFQFMKSIELLYGTRRPILDGLSKQGSVECTWVTEVGHEEEHSLTFAKCNVPIRSYSTPKKAVLSVEDIVLVSTFVVA